MKNNIQVLCTRPLDEMLIDKANQNGIDVDIAVFIETEPIESVEVQQEIETILNASVTVVFTSMNAVEAVAENRVDEQPGWIIYCIGNTTRQLVQKYFPLSRIAGTADNAADLAVLIIEEHDIEEVVFFCGNLRREELPAILKEHDIEVNEIIVYETILLPHKIKKHYSGILFFSPSAVESFFTMNKAGDKTVLFAIGKTTAAAIKNYTTNRIIIADEPDKEGLFDKMIEYYT